MKKIISRIVMAASIGLLMSASVYADSMIKEPIPEFEFVKMFSGKDADFVKQHLGEPDEVMKRENDSGKVEFWIYKNIVEIGKTDETYKYTQVGIINGYVETLGNTNRTPK